MIKISGAVLFGSLAALFVLPSVLGSASLALDDAVFSALTNGPFVGGILYGGYWLDQSQLSIERYPRVGKWFLGGAAGFLALNGVMIFAWPAGSLTNNIGWALFALNAGGAGGLAVGLFEARAIDREVAAERQRTKRQTIERRNERLDEFASIVSHDLRNPLNVATGRIELATAEYDSEHLDIAADALDRMDALIDDLLALARSGRQIDEPEPVDLGDLSKQCWETVATADATLETDVDRPVRADRSRLRQLLENLVRNAVEHGGDEVTITVATTDDGFFVDDDGPGIPPEEREEVFGAGYSTTTGGAGIGLRIVEQVVDAHGWDVRVTEGADGGARFEITGVGFAAAPSR